MCAQGVLRLLTKATPHPISCGQEGVNRYLTDSSARESEPVLGRAIQKRDSAQPCMGAVQYKKIPGRQNTIWQKLVISQPHFLYVKKKVQARLSTCGQKIGTGYVSENTSLEKRCRPGAEWET